MAFKILISDNYYPSFNCSSFKYSQRFRVEVAAAGVTCRVHGIYHKPLHNRGTHFGSSGRSDTRQPWALQKRCQNQFWKINPPRNNRIRSFQSSSLASQTCCRTKRHEMKHAVSLREYLCLTEYFIREQTLWQTACVVPQMISCQEDLCFLLSFRAVVEIGIIYLSAYYPVNIYISLMCSLASHSLVAETSRLGCLCGCCGSLRHPEALKRAWLHSRKAKTIQFNVVYELHLRTTNPRVQRSSSCGECTS